MLLASHDDVDLDVDVAHDDTTEERQSEREELLLEVSVLPHVFAVVALDAVLAFVGMEVDEELGEAEQKREDPQNDDCHVFAAFVDEQVVVQWSQYGDVVLYCHGNEVQAGAVQCSVVECVYELANTASSDAVCGRALTEVGLIECVVECVAEQRDAGEDIRHGETHEKFEVRRDRRPRVGECEQRNDVRRNRNSCECDG